MENFTVTEQIDQIYDTLATQSATLIKVYERIQNYYPMSWLLISSNKSVFNKEIDILKKGIEKQSSEYIESKRVNTNLFISLAICIYILKTHSKRLSNRIKKAMSLVLNQLENNKRLRTPEMVGDILFFLSTSDEFKEKSDFLRGYLKNELSGAIKARNCVKVIDSCFGLLPLDESFDFHIFEECLKNTRLLNIDRIAKALIILSIHKNELKETYFSCLKERLKDEYVSKLSGILQAIVNGISLVESDLPNEEVKKAFAELKENEWTEAIEIEGKEIKLKSFSPSFLRVLNSKTIGLCLLSIELANKKTKVSLYPDNFEKFRSAWKEKKFGFGVNRQQMHYLHYFSLIMILGTLFGVLWVTNFHETIWNDISYLLLKGFEISYLVSISIYSLVVLVFIGIVITYHRTFRRLVQKGDIKDFDEVILLIPVVGYIIKKIRGEGK